MIKEVLDLVKNEYEIEEIEINDLKEIGVANMQYCNSAYYAKGLGHIGIMDVKDDKGVMKMQCLIINPFEIDMPLISNDIIEMIGNNIMMLEAYNTLIGNDFDDNKLQEVLDKYQSGFMVNPFKPQWYDYLRLKGTINGSTQDKELLNQLIIEYYATFLQEAKTARKVDINEKKLKAAVYTDGLLANGGPATDPFMMSVGKEKTTEFFKKVVFGA